MTNFEYKLMRSFPLNRVFKTPFFGLFDTFSEATAAIPSKSVMGYDIPELRERFRNYPVDLMRPADYPVLLHLREILRPGDRVVDLGGNIGMAYYTALKYYEVPKPLEWVICDVPCVLDAAREVAAREGSRSEPLRFITDLKDAGPCRLFFSAGTLQMIDATLSQLLAKLPEMPEHVLINRVPVWDRPRVVTLTSVYNLDFRVAPYIIFNRADFLADMAAAGYHLKDSWSCPESTFSIRFRPHMRLNAYSGFYFTRN